MMDSESTIHLNPFKADLVLDIFGMEKSFANFWWVVEASTDCVHHCLGFNLSSESLVVNDDRWEKA